MERKRSLRQEKKELTDMTAVDEAATWADLLVRREHRGPGDTLDAARNRSARCGRCAIGRPKTLRPASTAPFNAPTRRKSGGRRPSCAMSSKSPKPTPEPRLSTLSFARLRLFWRRWIERRRARLPNEPEQPRQERTDR